jgi:lysine-ketoglutarate reductase/saccharopine dehydrogenase-like protein (TIGR00300 family)
VDLSDVKTYHPAAMSGSTAKSSGGAPIASKGAPSGPASPRAGLKEQVETRGHLVDSGLMSRIFDTIIRDGAEFRVLQFDMGRTNEDLSYARIEVVAKSAAELDHVLGHLHEIGCARLAAPALRLEPAPADGIAPQAFYSTTNHPTAVHLDGAWVTVEAQRMDAAIVAFPGAERAMCTKLRDLRRGDQVVCGTGGVRVQPPARDRDRSDFAFMSNDVSSERRVRLVVSQLAREMAELKARGGKLIAVAGPVVVHTGGSEALCELIRGGYVSALLAGNALAVHDLENALYGTSLGISTSTGLAVEEGHHHHIRTINTVNTAGGIRAAVTAGKVKTGIMAACITAGIEFVLAGSLRDDGPLQETITDMNRAQDEHARVLQGAELVLILSSMLHGIAVGNMLPSSVRTICVDINPAVVTKLADRGTAHALGLVTDVGLFLHLLAQELGLDPGP